MFHQKRKTDKTVKRKLKSGASLVIVVCVSAFLVAFALAMVYTAGMMLSQANQRLKKERCYQLAKSFAGVLDEELKFKTPKEAQNAGKGDGFYMFVCRFLEYGAYGDYNPDYPESTVFHYAVKNNPLEEDYGKVTIALYKESDWEGGRIAGTYHYDGSSTAPDPLDVVAGNVAHYTLTVRVTAELDNLSYSYSTAYNQEATYGPDAVTFRRGDGTRIWWNEGSKTWTNGSGAPQEVPEGTAINYEIRPFTLESDINLLTGCTLKKTIPEKGESDTDGGEAETP